MDVYSARVRPILPNVTYPHSKPIGLFQERIIPTMSFISLLSSIMEYDC